MNIIETLPKTIEVNNEHYQLEVHVTAWDNLCIGYIEMFKKEGAQWREHICSVCVEPDHEPRKIEDTIGYLNEGIGNARTLDDAALMLKEYVEKNYKVYEDHLS
jgi:hypothetical protein